MKFGVREICDVVLRAKAAQKIGNKIFYKIWCARRSAA